MCFIFLCFLATKDHFYLATLSWVFFMVHFVVLMFFLSIHCCVTFYVLNILDALCCGFCLCCSPCTAFVVLATSLFGCCPFYFGGGYSSWRWFTYNLYRESYPAVKRSSSADFISGCSCNSAALVCRQGVLLGDLYTCWRFVL